MKTLLNGKPIPFSDLKDIMVGHAPDDVNLAHYVDNGTTIAFNPVALRYGEDIISIWGENNLWEMIHFTGLSELNKVVFSDSMYDFVQWSSKRA